MTQQRKEGRCTHVTHEQKMKDSLFIVAKQLFYLWSSGLNFLFLFSPAGRVAGRGVGREAGGRGQRAVLLWPIIAVSTTAPLSFFFFLKNITDVFRCSLL